MVVHQKYRVLKVNAVTQQPDPPPPKPAFDPDIQKLELPNGNQASVYRIDGRLCFRQIAGASKTGFKRAIRSFCDKVGLIISKWDRSTDNDVIAVC